MYCPKCGTELPIEAIFCEKCGTKVNFPTSNPNESGEKTTQEEPTAHIEAEQNEKVTEVEQKSHIEHQQESNSTHTHTANSSTTSQSGTGLSWINETIKEQKEIFNAIKEGREENFSTNAKIINFLLLWLVVSIVSNLPGEICGIVVLAICAFIFITKVLNWKGTKRTVSLSFAGIFCLFLLLSEFYVPSDTGSGESQTESSISSDSDSEKEVITFTSEQVVRDALCRYKFKSNAGNTVTFSNNAYQMECNGRPMSSSTSITVVSSEKAIVRCSGPYGDTTLALVAYEWGGMGFTDMSDGSVYTTEY